MDKSLNELVYGMITMVGILLICVVALFLNEAAALSGVYPL